ncbi:MAG TPA: hypothetical protein VF790_11725 [Dissulfurispiraceae bacterium]
MTTKDIIALLEKAIMISFAAVPALQPFAPAAAAIPTLVDSVQTVVGKGNGQIKKAAVSTGVKTALAVVDSVSTGGQKDTIDKFMPVANNLIDDVVEVFNQAGVWGKSDPTGVSPSSN